MEKISKKYISIFDANNGMLNVEISGSINDVCNILVSVSGENESFRAAMFAAVVSDLAEYGEEELVGSLADAMERHSLIKAEHNL